MQRTFVIYAAALTTLIGALLLAPKVIEAPPEPPAPPPPPVTKVDHDPITRLTFADAALQIDARLDRGRILGAEDLWLDVKIKATDSASRAPLSAVLVVDRSGSMAGVAGDKIDQARTAAARFVSRLQDGDQLALISYGTDVSIDMPLTTVDSQSKQRARRLIGQIEEGGGTNIDGALRAAQRTIENAGSLAGVARVVLVSDGRPTEGERREDRLARHAAALRDLGATVSTLGLGLDYNDNLMERLAVDGSGRYHYLRHGKQLAAILDDELKHATAVVARGVKLHLADAAFRVVAAPGVKLDSRADGAMLFVGDIAAGEERSVLVKLRPEQARLVALNHLRAPEVTYLPAGETAAKLLTHRADSFRVVKTDDAALAAASVDDGVRIRVLEVEGSVALTDSMNFYAKGNVNQAKDVLRRNKNRLEEVARRTKSKKLMEQAISIDRVLKKVDAAPPASAPAQDMIKHEKARAYSLRR
jgi:Ca-activated chloride channel family protein